MSLWSKLFGRRSPSEEYWDYLTGQTCKKPSDAISGAELYRRVMSDLQHGTAVIRSSAMQLQVFCENCKTIDSGPGFLDARACVIRCPRCSVIYGTIQR